MASRHGLAGGIFGFLAPTFRYWMRTEVHVYAFSVAANVLLSFRVLGLQRRLRRTSQLDTGYGYVMHLGLRYCISTVSIIKRLAPRHHATLCYVPPRSQK